MKLDPEAVPMSLQWLVVYHAPLRGYEFGECVHVLRTMVGSEGRGNRFRIVKERWAWTYCVPLRFDYDADDWAWEWLLVDVLFVMAAGFRENRHGDVLRAQREQVR